MTEDERDILTQALERGVNIRFDADSLVLRIGGVVIESPDGTANKTHVTIDGFQIEHAMVGIKLMCPSPASYWTIEPTWMIRPGPLLRKRADGCECPPVPEKFHVKPDTS